MNQRKAISPIIATIIILLVTIAIAGAGYSYISTYWSGLIGKEIQVVSSFCTGGSQGRIMVKSIGTNPVKTSEITVLNAQTGQDITSDVFWGSSDMVSDTNLVVKMSLDEGGGTTAYDSAGDNNGTLGNGACSPGSGACPNWTTGKVGWSLDFDGSDDYVLMGPAAPSLAEIAGDKLTVTAWIKPSTLSGSGVILIKNGPINFARSGAILIGGVHTVNLYWPTAIGTIPLTTKWNHVAMTYDGNEVKLFVNGVFDTSIPAQGGNLAGDGCTQIGRRNDGGCNGNPGGYFKGKIDDVKIYKRALSPEEIAALAGNFPVQPGETVTMNTVCPGRCRYNLILGWGAKESMLEC